MFTRNECSARAVLIDANVWFSRTLSDWLLAIQDATTEYQLLWTEDIAAEVIANIRKKSPNSDGDIIRSLSLKIRNFLGSDHEIVGYQSKPTQLVNDRGDDHVVGAALHAEVDFLVTNDKDFISSDQVRYELCTADDFFMHIHEHQPKTIEEALSRVFERTFKDHYESSSTKGIDLPKKLRDAGANHFAQVVWEHLNNPRGINSFVKISQKEMRKIQSAVGKTSL